ncbi:MAG: carbohydrate porin [Bdellovibrionales bacterium]|nr:carbohydrate porin [Bdellovibrionales bacterium]
MNTRLTYKTLVLGLLVSSFAAWGQSTTSNIEFPSFKLNRLKDYISADLFYTHDFVSSTGGVKAGPRNIGALDIYIESDLSKYSSVQGEFMAHYIHINQNDTRASIGDAQGASNIDMPQQVDRIVDLWYQQNWNDKIKTLAGIHDISMEFNVTESSLSFLNASFGTSAELSLAGPSLYPITSLGTRTQYMFNDELSLKTGLYDANVGDETTYRSFHSDIGNQTGYMHISELAHQQDHQKVALAGWNFTRSQEKLAADGRANSYGTYGLYERKFGHNTWAFARYGWANPLVSAIQSNVSTGVVYRGILQRKKTNDEVGMGVSQVHFSRSHMKNVAIEENSGTTSKETAYEAYYQFKPLRILSLRPDVQYITNPSGVKNIKDAWAVGMRTVVEL